MDYHTVCDKVDCEYYKGNVRQEDRCRLNCIHNISFCKDYYTPKSEPNTINSASSDPFTVIMFDIVAKAV